MIGKEAKWEREGGWHQEKSTSQDLGRPKYNGAVCQRAAH